MRFRLFFHGCRTKQKIWRNKREKENWCTHQSIRAIFHWIFSQQKWCTLQFKHRIQVVVAASCDQIKKNWRKKKIENRSRASNTNYFLSLSLCHLKTCPHHNVWYKHNFADSYFFIDTFFRYNADTVCRNDNHRQSTPQTRHWQRRKKKTSPMTTICHNIYFISRERKKKRFNFSLFLSTVPSFFLRIQCDDSCLIGL